MGSLGTGEILVIALVALIVFGPQRLPEITRKAGELLAKARQMSKSVTDTIDAELGEVSGPIKDLKGEYDATMSQMKGVASSIPDLSVDLPTIELNPDGDAKQAADDSSDVGEPARPDTQPSDDEES